MDNAERALMMAFSVIVLGFAIAIAMFLFSKVTATSEQLAFYSDSTIYYDNVELTKKCSSCSEDNPYYVEKCKKCNATFPDIESDPDADIKNGTTRIVNTETIIPTLYRYYKENFCVKIYGAGNKLIQIFDVNLEGKVHGAAGDTHASATATNPTNIRNHAYNVIYNRPNEASRNITNYKYKKTDSIDIPYFMFGAPWLGSTESVKTRIDYFIDGKAGYINNTYVNYANNEFYQARMNKAQFSERFINYSYTGQSFTTEDGDTLVTGEKSKDKIVIIYTLIESLGS